jgi:UDP-N-acetylglucosamine diphosphorylase / glucose-1-phosphate thymidylyltransferase / UDP-N-acetylgalactosamine diphosphorylase / glucosamine-1-phosphate N-acetyltransferase / galactosamine-1-phosphate N-acetyltransferase
MKAIILAAGDSTRLYPLTLTKPKPLLKVAGRTILEHNLADEVIIVIGYKEEMIKKYAGDSFGKIKLNYIEEKERLGTAHALGMAAGKVKGNFIVMYGDDLYSKNDIKNCLKHKNCVLAKKVSDPSRFGVLLLEGNKVKKIVEKPKEFISDMANTGLYVLGEEIFDEIKKVTKSIRGEYELTDAISELAGQTEVNYEEVKECWSAISFPWNLLEANEYLLGISKGKIAKSAIVEKGATLKGEITVGEETIIKNGVYIEGPAIIGKKCVIGPNCYIRASTAIGNHSHIGNAVEIKNSIIGDNTNVAHLSYVGDSIIGDNCNLGAGTITANLRHDWKNIRCMVKGELKDTGRQKLGVIMGDNCKTGVHTSLFPGIKINSGCMTLPGEVVKRDPEKNNF